MVVVMVAFLRSRLRLCSTSLEPNPLQLLPRSIADLQRQHNLNLLYNSTDAECIAMLCMRKAPFFALCRLFRDRGLLMDTINSCVEEQVSMFLHVVGHYCYS
jgi:hypothetical protein